jgi:hypothetical protein
MNIWAFPVTCDRCGGEGVGSVKTAAAEWDPDMRLLHTDRRICDANLREKKIS